MIRQTRILHSVLLVMESFLFGMFVIAIGCDQFEAILSGLNPSLTPICFQDKRIHETRVLHSILVSMESFLFGLFVITIACDQLVGIFSGLVNVNCYVHKTDECLTYTFSGALLLCKLQAFPRGYIFYSKSPLPFQFLVKND